MCAANLYFGPNPTQQHKPFEVPEGARVWHVDSTGLDLEIRDGKAYKLVPAGQKDVEKVLRLYSQYPVSGYSLASVYIIYNRNLDHAFQATAATLERRRNNPAFTVDWPKENNPEWRQKIYEMYKQMVAPYRDSQYPSVKFLPAWHGTKSTVVDSICSTGFANLALTDSGYFGKGLYSTAEAEYAQRVYSKEGILILNYVAFFAAYPVIDGDMGKLTGRANYANYDAHFVPVVPRDPKNPNETQYFPCRPGEKNRYTEIVVFDRAQCFPRYLVTLQKDLTKSPALPAHKPANQPLPNKILQAQSDCEKGNKLYTEKNYAAALQLYLKAAAAGLSEAQYMVGQCYYKGRVGVIDYGIAIDYLQRAAQQNHPQALYMIGVILYNGDAVPKDEEKSKGYFQAAYQLGSADAKTALQTLFKPGKK